MQYAHIYVLRSLQTPVAEPATVLCACLSVYEFERKPHHVAGSNGQAHVLVRVLRVRRVVVRTVLVVCSAAST